jgi:hypothetical protein
MTDQINTIGFRMNMVRTMYKVLTKGEEEYSTDAYEDIDLIIVRLFTQIERILEINKLETITTEVVEAARDSLVIGIK